jgi:preprotein translocase subunit SecD
VRARLVGRTAIAVFKVYDASGDEDADSSCLAPRRPLRDPMNPGWLCLAPNPFITGDMIVAGSVEASPPFDELVVQFRLTSEGRLRLEAFSSASTDPQMAFVLNGRVLSAPVLMTPIRGGAGQISLAHLQGEAAAELADRIRAYAPPVELIVVEIRDD